MALAEGTPGTATLPVSYYDGVNARPILIAPRSRGYLTLNETDPTWGAPLIYPGYFTDPHDLDVMIAGIRIGRKLFDTQAFKDNGFSLLNQSLPACQQHEFDSDEYWRCVARHYTSTIYHFVGTCKMGPKSDPDAVVDAKLKVHGVKGLRVVDASIMPNITRGNTNAPTIMIGEKISHLMTRFWFHRSNPTVEYLENDY